MKNTSLFIVVFLLLNTGIVFAQENSDNANSATVNEEFSLDDLLAELDKSKPTNEQPGSDLLDLAIEIKLTTKSVSDFDRILNLAQQALKKGLSDEEAAIARGIIRSTLLQRASLVAEILREERTDSENEIPIVVQIGMADLKQIPETFTKKQNEKNFEGADLYWYIKSMLLYYSQANSKDIADAIKTAKKLNKSNKIRLAQLYYLEFMLNTDSPKELELITKAYNNNPESKTIKQAYILYLAGSGELEKAAKLILDIPEDELSPSYMLIMAQYNQKINNPEKALEWLNKIPAPASESLVIYSAKLECAVVLKDEKLTLELSEKILRQEPENIGVRFLRVAVFNDRKEYDKSLEEISHARFLVGDSIVLQMAQWVVLCKKDKSNYEAARKAIDDVLSKDDASVQDVDWTMDVALEMQDNGLKEKIAQRVLTMIQQSDQEPSPREIGMYRRSFNILLRVFITQKQYDKVIDLFENAVKIFPEDDLILNNYSWLLATFTDDSVRDGKKALDLALKAAKLTDYKSATVLSTLAAAYAELGDFEKALNYSQQALSVNDDEEVAESIKKEIESYKQQKPIRNNFFD